MISKMNPTILKELGTRCDWVGLRYYFESTKTTSVRDSKFDNFAEHFDGGVMIEVIHQGSHGFCGTSDLSDSGIRTAFQKALDLARGLASHQLFPHSPSRRMPQQGQYKSPRQQNLDSFTLSEIYSHLIHATDKMNISPFIVSRMARSMIIQTESFFFSSNGSEIHQNFDIVLLDFQATAKDGPETQYRTANGFSAIGNQIGAEKFNKDEFQEISEEIARDALVLVKAPNCPTGTYDLLLAPDQMMLQIHESIGHPLELDRILGDERNYAGWSFVQLNDFGKLQYGSPLMNVTFDPSGPGQLAGYRYDDQGTPAEKHFLIENGILKRALGSFDSSARSQIPGVANSRASSWNRAPIDRMANINLEPGNSDLEKMIESTKNGILMRSNKSWSIDDYRHKFQFGCEWGELIKDGKRMGVVKNPNYRGTTLEFWNSLKDLSKQTAHFGTAYCGKGEPNQTIRVSHSSPWALFSNIQVFGGHQ